MFRTYDVRPCKPLQCGLTICEKGVSFCIFSRHATQVELLLFEDSESVEPFQVVKLDPRLNRTFFFWHVMVEGLPAGTGYAWRVDGPNHTSRSGLRFDYDKALLDPWARAVSLKLWSRHDASVPGDNCATSLRGLVTNGSYDWEGDRLVELPLHDSVIYELHVGGFTRHDSAGVKHPGTFAGLIEKIPYLQELGITHVELLPVMAFDPQDIPMGASNLGLENYWGYSTLGYFAPHPGFCVSEGKAVKEFRDLVKALHRAGIGVILDVVFNHTAEGNSQGPTIHFKGMMNESFYHLDQHDRSYYRDYTGCGNTVNANNPIATHFILHALEYWVQEMHVDGFRFDLASALARGEDGNPLYHAPVIWGIELSNSLSRAHLIAEAWDAAGLYQVGDFPGMRWADWNGLYRDVIRRFVRGDPGLIAEVASRITGSSDLHEKAGRLPGNSINFITCHDGFTLNDLVSYNHKRNWANGEGNRDGNSDNLSWNCGVEGVSVNPKVLALRQQQARNLIAILLLSQGAPMLLAGDELLRTQGGNNNGYCQNNALSWIDWTLLDENREMFDFVKGMIAFRRRHPALRQQRYLTGKRQEGQAIRDIAWHGLDLHAPPWKDPIAKILAFTLSGVEPDEPHLHAMFNMSEFQLPFRLPCIPGRRWHRVVDTAVTPSIFDPAEQSEVKGRQVKVASRSLMVLESHPLRQEGATESPHHHGAPRASYRNSHRNHRNRRNRRSTPGEE